MRIAFIGLGTMGKHMAANLLEHGHELVVHDIRREAADPFLKMGARWADSPAAAAREAEMTLTSLPGPKEVELVALGPNGVIEGAAAGSVYADLSTSSPTLIRRIYNEFAKRGIHVLDSPVSGGPRGAERGTLQLMIGGDEAVFERVKGALGAIGDKVSHIGEIGSGEVAKLCHNLAGYCQQVALAEVFTLGVKAGVRPEKLLEAIKGGAYGQGHMFEVRMPDVILKEDFDNARFALQLARKDVGLATELAREFQVPMAVSAITEQVMIEGLVRGWGAKDSSSIWMIQEERAGVKVRVD